MLKLHKKGDDAMRKANIIISHLMIILFAVHVIFGSFLMLGVSHILLHSVAILFIILTVVHAVIGTILTIRTDITQNKAGVRYQKENSLFWTRRNSGFAVLVLMIFHVIVFSKGSSLNGPPPFNTFGLITNLLMVAALAVHIVSNIKSLFIGSGIKRPKILTANIIFVLSVILLLATVAFISYYIWWKMQ